MENKIVYRIQYRNLTTEHETHEQMQTAYRDLVMAGAVLEEMVWSQVFLGLFAGIVIDEREIPGVRPTREQLALEI